MIAIADVLGLVLVAVVFAGLIFAAVWVLQEDIGPDIDSMREARKRDGGAI